MIKKGKGKEYNRYGKLEFQGQYLKGQRWNGKIREYNRKGDLEFEGEYKNRKKNEIGKEYYDNGQEKFICYR